MMHLALNEEFPEYNSVTIELKKQVTRSLKCGSNGSSRGYIQANNCKNYPAAEDVSFQHCCKSKRKLGNNYSDDSIRKDLAGVVNTCDLIFTVTFSSYLYLWAASAQVLFTLIRLHNLKSVEISHVIHQRGEIMSIVISYIIVFHCFFFAPKTLQIQKQKQSTWVKTHGQYRITSAVFLYFYWLLFSVVIVISEWSEFILHSNHANCSHRRK